VNAAVSPQSVNPAMLLLELGHRARAAGSIAELNFLLVNDSRLLTPYRQSCLWLHQGGIVALSGVIEPTETRPTPNGWTDCANFCTRKKSRRFGP
jgi:hypothetical protein